MYLFETINYDCTLWSVSMVLVLVNAFNSSTCYLNIWAYKFESLKCLLNYFGINSI